jgi:hypothetical protein
MLCHALDAEPNEPPPKIDLLAFFGVLVRSSSAGTLRACALDKTARAPGTNSQITRYGGCWVGRWVGGHPMARADYFRRQASTCLRLSRVSSSKQIANELIVLAQDYYAKADALVGEQNSLPTDAVPHPDVIRKW